MQTFLPLPSLPLSFKVLDQKRCGNQRNETFVILNTLNFEYSGWKNHPIIKMWAGYENFLALYFNLNIEEWISRGNKNSYNFAKFSKIEVPNWFPSIALHSSHRAALLFKNYEYYSRFGWNEEPKIDYIWPISDKYEDWLRKSCNLKEI